MADIARARQLRKAETWAEKLMWRWLRDRRFSNYKFRRQHPEGVYYLDFFCEAARLSIELHGFGHGHPDQQRHDAERKAFLISRGIKELRFWNSSLRATRKAFVTPFSASCRNARRIRCRITHVRLIRRR